MRIAGEPGSSVPRRSFWASGGPTTSNGRSSSLSDVTGRLRKLSGSGCSGRSSGSTIVSASLCWPRALLLAADARRVRCGAWNSISYESPALSSPSACQVRARRSGSAPRARRRRRSSYRRPRTAHRAGRGPYARAPGPCGLGGPALLEVGLRVGPERVGHAAHDPALAVEVLEVLELPVLRALVLIRSISRPSRCQRIGP